MEIAMHPEGTLSRLKAAHDDFCHCLHQLQEESDQAAASGGNWHKLLVGFVRHLETDQKLLANLVERAEVEMKRL
ncbi:MAG: hypothetical protein M3256_09750 [Actinomycetota bacterium]|nr:hypothetical protein [Actinomycetota bacterium]